MEPSRLPGTPTAPASAQPGQEPANGNTSTALDERRCGLVELEPGVRSQLSSPEALRGRPQSKTGGEPARSAVALFCYEGPDSHLCRYVTNLAEALAKRSIDVHLFTRLPLPVKSPGVTVHAVGPTESKDLLESVDDFTLLCAEAFGKKFPTNASAPALVGLEWSTISILQMLRERTDREALLSLTSLERQRSDMSSELSKQIEETELRGLRENWTILAQDPAVSEAIRLRLPDSPVRIVPAVKPFPTHRFQGVTDPGQVKARFQIGPVDPTILYIGDLDHRHGPDVLMKAAPAILKNHPQARFVFVGDGDLLWPLRVYARYLTLEGVVRLVGHLEGQALYELFQAADLVVVPSREATEWWPLQAAWAAETPLVATHAMNCKFLEHEQNAVLTYPHESSLVWGVERILYDPALREMLVQNGAERLEERFGWNSVAAQLEELLLPRLAEAAK